MNTDSRPNVVWIVLDALRADHTTMHGYERDTTPRIQSIADRPDGSSFRNCFSHSIGTRVSISSMLTGVYPSAHGVQALEGAIPDELRTIPELLGEVGYHSVAISRNSNVSEATRLHRGFDDFTWFGSPESLLRNVDPDVLLKYLLNIRKHSVGFSTDLVDYSIAYVVNRLAERKLKRLQRSTEPFFMFLHYLGPHDPYVPPIPYQDRYLDGLDVSRQEAVGMIKEVFENRWMYNTGAWEFSETERGVLNAMYDAEVAYTDECIGELFSFVQSLDLANDTVFVVTADHGDFLGERGVVGHEFFLDDILTNVPLVVHGPGFEDVSTDDLVQHIDVQRTLLERADADTEQLHGVDLRTDTREYAVLERRQPLDVEDLKGYNPAFDATRVPQGDVRALRTKRFKYLVSDAGEHLYELPDETTPVDDVYPSVRADLADAFETWARTDGTPLGQTRDAELTDDMRSQLSDLGYLVD